MTTGTDLVRAAETFLGEPYSTAPGRTSPTSGFKDCSGLVAAAYQVATGRELGAYVSVTIWKQSADLGLAISRDDALGIAGACLLIPDDPLRGWGPNGHIGFTTGDGHTIEATPAYAGGVQRLRVDQQRWGPNACLLPGIDYTNNGQGAGTPDTQEDDGMGSALAAFDGLIYVVDFDANTRCAIANQEALAAWQALATLAGKNPTVFTEGAVVDIARQAVDLRNPPAVVTVPGDCPPGLDTATPKQLVAELAERIGD